MSGASHPPGTVTLIGSGAMSASMGKVHRAVMSKVAGPLRAVFLDTPAGFELNADQISARAVEYFKQHLSVDLTVVSFKAAAVATPVEVDKALRKLRSANYIFAGPGSPSYAIRNWQNTAIMKATARRLATGAHLVFESAAAIAMGRYALPVYEIYKVGEEPRWIEGLDLLGPYDLELAIVPHWNNTEGGTYDTRYCFMGEPRLKLLEKSLPESATILGIDEYTACIVGLSSGECQVMGAGRVTIRQKGREISCPAGTTFDLGQLRGTLPVGEQPEATAEPEEKPDAYPAGFDWPDTLEGDMASVAPFVELIIAVRAKLRAARQWEMADEIRSRLSGLGIILEDGPTETTWRRA